MRRFYNTKLYSDDREHAPACYGRSWEPDDVDCAGCQMENDCQNETIRRSPSYQAPAKKIEVQSDPTEMIGKTVFRSTGSDKGIIQFQDGIMLMPTEEEGWGTSLGKNMIAGALAAVGKEVFRFFSRFRFR